MEEYLLSAIATELKIIPSDLSKIYSSRTDIPFPEIEHKNYKLMSISHFISFFML